MALPLPVSWAPLGEPPPRPIDLVAGSSPSARVSHSYLSGSVLGGTLSYPELWSYAWYELARLDAPVRLRFSESVREGDIFSSPALEAAFFPMVDLPLGSMYAIGDELASPDLYAFRVAAKSASGGLLSYTGEGLLADLDRTRPTASLVVLPGQGGAPNPLTPRAALIRFLDYYRVPYALPIPEFYLRTPEGVFVPTLEAFVLQPGERPESLYGYLRRFFAPFAGYVFRANEANVLEVSPPAWLDVTGITLTLGRWEGSSVPAGAAPWPYPERRPVVSSHWTVFGGAGSVVAQHEALLAQGVPTVLTHPATAATLTLTWDGSTLNATIGPLGETLQRVELRARPEQVEGRSFLRLTQADLGLEGSVSTDADSIVNRATLTVRGYQFVPDQQIMTPSCLLLRGPAAVPGGIWPPQTIGPASAPTTVPAGFEVLFNRVGSSAGAFWRVADAVVGRPGAPITITMQVEEWRDVWSHSLMHIGPELNHAATVTFDLPVDGREHLVHNLRYEKYGIGGTSAWGRVWATWLGGGIQVRVEHQAAMSGWTLFGGQVYFIYGVSIQLSGVGMVFMESGTQFTASFGYSQEDDAALPGLADSRARYGERERRLDLGIYVLDEPTALAICRAVVEANLNPRTVHAVGVVPAGEYRLRPWHLGRAVVLPTGEVGVVRAYNYSESHAPGSSSSSLSAEIEIDAPLTRERARRRHYGRIHYSVNHYQRV